MKKSNYLIDLISDKHIELRASFIKKLQREFSVPLNSTETYFLHLIEKNSFNASKLASELNISRQGCHKIIKKLEEVEIIQRTSMPDNQKEKVLSLTLKGKEIMKALKKLNNNIEKKIEAHLGKQNVEKLKKLFEKDWDI